MAKEVKKDRVRPNNPGSDFYQRMVWNDDHTELVPCGEKINIQEQIDAAAVGTRVYEVIDRVLRGVADLDTSVDWQETDVSGMPEYLADAKEIANRKPDDAAIAAAKAEIQALEKAQQQKVADEKQKEDDEKLRSIITDILSKMKENQ